MKKEVSKGATEAEKKSIKITIDVGDVLGNSEAGSCDSEFIVPMGAEGDIVAGAALREGRMTIAMGTAMGTVDLEMPNAIFAALREKMDSVKIPAEG